MPVGADGVRGVIAALVTPYNEYGGIDTAGVGRLVEHAIAGGVDGLLVCDGIGEGPHLSRGERLFVIEAALEAAAGRVPLWAGTGAVSTEETIALTRDAARAGVDAAAIIAPFYYALPQEALAAHYRELAARGGLPVVVHNAPRFGGNELAPATLAELARTEGIVGAIAGDPDFGRLVETLHLAGDAFPILAGFDSGGYAALEAGARGFVSALASIVPGVVAGIYGDAVAGNDHEGTRRRHQRLVPLARLLERDPGGIAAAKEALSLLGLPGGVPRRPLPQPLDRDREAVRAALAALGLL